MLREIGAPHRFISSAPHRLFLSLTVPGACALALSFLAGAYMLQANGGTIISIADVDESPASKSASSIALDSHGAVLVDLRSRAAPVSLAESFPSEWGVRSLPLAPVATQQAENARPTQSAMVAEQDQGAAPLPPPRPAEFASSASRSASRAALRQLAERKPVSAPAPAAPANRSFFEQFFGVTQASNPQASRSSALAYAAPESGVLDTARKMLSDPLVRYDRYTAVYEIATHTVHLPNGTKLEAHSGLGSRIDDPRYVHESMRGATPPNVYELTLREKLFHGVQALRLAPVGDGNVYGRAGLLAHSYMLGPRGDSNGCVVFKNYGAFLQAFQNGEVKRLAVVARLD